MNEFLHEQLCGVFVYTVDQHLITLSNYFLIVQLDNTPDSTLRSGKGVKGLLQVHVRVYGSTCNNGDGIGCEISFGHVMYLLTQHIGPQGHLQYGFTLL